MMTLPRRQLLKVSSVLSIGLPSFSIFAKEETPEASAISYVRTKNQQAAPLLKKGDFVLVDSEITTYTEDGVYLYPSWGEPTAYHVTQNEHGALEFYYPNKSIKLWETHMDTNQAIFSGKAIGFVDGQSLSKSEKLLAEHTELKVPKLPLR